MAESRADGRGASWPGARRHGDHRRASCPTATASRSCATSRPRSPETVVIVMTAFGSTETAVAAMKLGAHDYLTKPFDVEELKIVVRGALEKRQLERGEPPAQGRVPHAATASTASSASRRPWPRCSSMVRSVAPTSSTVLITGESGTGKELVAQAIHALSPRQDAPFVAVNCGALPETLLESELFGHVKGAFTDAHQNKKGLFEAAHGGTLFLDEIGETPPAMQVKLLRALQEQQDPAGGRHRRDRGRRPRHRRHQPPPGASWCEERRFREDLFYRLQRDPDPHCRRCASGARTSRSWPSTSSKRFARGDGEARRRDLERGDGPAACATRWPGNVRELENVIERAVALETTPTRSCPSVSPTSLRAEPVAPRPSRPGARGRLQPGRAPARRSSGTCCSEALDQARRGPGRRPHGCSASRPGRSAT